MMLAARDTRKILLSQPVSSTRSVTFTEKAFAAVGIELRWEGERALNEKGYDKATGKMLVCVNPAWFRPTDVDNLWGDPTKAKTVLGWNPQKTTYAELVTHHGRT